MHPVPSFVTNIVSYLPSTIAILYLSSMASPFSKALGIVCPSMAIYEIALFVLTKMKQPWELATLPPFLTYIALVYRIHYQHKCQESERIKAQNQAKESQLISFQNNLQQEFKVSLSNNPQNIEEINKLQKLKQDTTQLFQQQTEDRTRILFESTFSIAFLQ